MSVIWPLSKLFARAPASVENRSQYEQCLLYTYSIIYHTDGWQRHRNTRDDNTAPCQQKWMQFFRVPHSFECGNFIAKYKNHESTQSAAAVEAGSGSVYFPERTDGRVNSGHAECYTLFTAQIAQGTKSSFFFVFSSFCQMEKDNFGFLFFLPVRAVCTTHFYGTAYVNISMGWAGEDERQVLLRQAVQMGTVFVVGCVDRRNSYYRYWYSRVCCASRWTVRVEWSLVGKYLSFDHGLMKW